MEQSRGSINSATIIIAGLSVLAIGLGVLTATLFVNNSNLQDDIDSRVDIAVAEAKKKQAEELESIFAEREKEPMNRFTGPEDYGSLSFKHPRTWSVFIARDASSGGEFEAYLNPGSVPAPSASQIFALRVNIKPQEYSAVVKSFDGLVKSGKLRSSVFTLGDIVGTRFDGEFSTDIIGAQIVLRVRDKTITIRTDSEAFLGDFNNLIKTIELNL